VARKPKIEQQKSADPASPGSNGSATDSVATAKTKAKTTSSSPKKKKAAPKKKAATSKPAASKKADSPAKVSGPSDEEIRIRAYFLAERRLQLSLPGDSAHDWIEAKRQLLEEARPASS
jgi:hypothetical protein